VLLARGLLVSLSDSGCLPEQPGRALLGPGSACAAWQCWRVLSRRAQTRAKRLTVAATAMYVHTDEYRIS
jgi:hypothetical protein